MESRRQWDDVCNMLKGKVSLVILRPAKNFKNEGEIETFPG